LYLLTKLNIISIGIFPQTGDCYGGVLHSGVMYGFKDTLYVIIISTVFSYTMTALTM